MYKACYTLSFENDYFHIHVDLLRNMAKVLKKKKQMFKNVKKANLLFPHRSFKEYGQVLKKINKCLRMLKTQLFFFIFYRTRLGGM